MAQTDSNITPEDLGTFTNPRGYSLSETGSNLSGQLSLVISNIVGTITLIAGLAFLIYFILGAVNLITSGSDPQKIKSAQQMMLNAAIGLVIAAAAYPLVYVLGKITGIPILNPAELINSINLIN